MSLIDHIRYCNTLKISDVISEANVDINEVDEYGNSCLMLAIKNRLEITVSRLLDKPDIDANHENKMGETALLLACRKRMKIIALRILDSDYVCYDNIPGEYREWLRGIGGIIKDVEHCEDIDISI
jgi:hypothetical protein